MKGKFHYTVTAKSFNSFFKLTRFALGSTGKLFKTLGALSVLSGV